MEANRDAFKKIVGIFSTGELTDIPSVISPDYHDHQGLRGVEITGREGFATVVSAARQGLHGLKVVIKDMIAEGDRVAARLEWHGTDASGLEVTRETIDIIRFERGQAAEHWGTRLGYSAGE